MNYVEEITAVAKKSDADAIKMAVDTIANYCYNTAKCAVCSLIKDDSNIMIDDSEAKKAAILINTLADKELFDIENDFDVQAMKLVNSLCKKDRERRYGVETSW